jgi:dienelactone hydrolase
VKNIQAPVSAHYGEKDAGVNKGINETAAAMKKYNKIYDYKIYSGAQRAFNNDGVRNDWLFDDRENILAGCAAVRRGRSAVFGVAIAPDSPLTIARLPAGCRRYLGSANCRLYKDIVYG